MSISVSIYKGTVIRLSNVELIHPRAMCTGNRLFESDAIYNGLSILYKPPPPSNVYIYCNLELSVWLRCCRKGDYHRYLAEFATGNDRKEAAENSLVAYKAASDIAMTELPPTHPIRYPHYMDSSRACFALIFATTARVTWPSRWTYIFRVTS